MSATVTNPFKDVCCTRRPSQKKCACKEFASAPRDLQDIVTAMIESVRPRLDTIKPLANGAEKERRVVDLLRILSMHTPALQMIMMSKFKYGIHKLLDDHRHMGYTMDPIADHMRHLSPRLLNAFDVSKCVYYEGWSSDGDCIRHTWCDAILWEARGANLCDKHQNKLAAVHRRVARHLPTSLVIMCVRYIVPEYERMKYVIRATGIAAKLRGDAVVLKKVNARRPCTPSEPRDVRQRAASTGSEPPDRCTSIADGDGHQ